MLLNALSMGGAPPYIANAVDFDGANDYLSRGADLSGNVNSKIVTSSLWIKTATNGTYVYKMNQDSYLYIQSGKFGVIMLNAGVAIILDCQGSSNVANNAWHNILFSCDLSDSGKRFMYVDDAAETPTWTTYTNDIIDWTQPNHGIMAGPGGALKTNGDVADLWIDNAEYIDFSVENNRRRFISPGGKPVYLGPNGSSGSPTSSAPIMFFSGHTAAWHTNKGTGGGFTENGALTTAATSPSD